MIYILKNIFYLNSKKAVVVLLPNHVVSVYRWAMYVGSRCLVVPVSPEIDVSYAARKRYRAHKSTGVRLRNE